MWAGWSTSSTGDSPNKESEFFYQVKKKLKKSEKSNEKMETLMSMEEMRAQLEQLEREETEIDDQLGQVIKQQPDLLIKGFGFYTFSYFSHTFNQIYQSVTENYHRNYRRTQFCP